MLGTPRTNILELDDLALSLLVTTQLKVLASFDGQHSLGSAVGLHTLKPQHNLLCSLGLFTENRLCLTAITGLLPVVSPFTLSVDRILALLVLGHLVRLMLLALLAVSPAGLRYVDHGCDRMQRKRGSSIRQFHLTEKIIHAT